MSSAIATHSFAANVLRVGARNAGRTAPSRANRMTVRAAASNGGLAIDLRGAFHFSRRRDFVCARTASATPQIPSRKIDPTENECDNTGPIGAAGVVGSRIQHAPSPARAVPRKSEPSDTTRTLLRDLQEKTRKTHEMVFSIAAESTHREYQHEAHPLHPNYPRLASFKQARKPSSRVSRMTRASGGLFPSASRRLGARLF